MSYVSIENFPRVSLRVLPLLLAAMSAPVWAQTAPTTLPEVVVTGHPLGATADQLAIPVTVLSAPALDRQRAATLGATLAQEPGIASSDYGPNAARPVIRGLDGERVRILQSGVAILDASGTSVDHAVSIDPLLVERIEVLRGAAGLLYGGSAIGGVVNLVDGRIPQAAPANGLEGQVETRFGSADRERSTAARFSAGGPTMVWYGAAFDRRSVDLRIPGHARTEALRNSAPLPADESEPHRRLPNSAATHDGGVFGGSLLFDQGYVGAAIATQRSRYGVVAEPDVTIGLRQQRLDLAGEVRNLGAAEAVRFRLGRSDYQHTEFEGDAVGTVFRNKGTDARFEWLHSPWSGLRGVWGVQLQDFRFSALGEEAFLPETRNRAQALFAMEELIHGAWRSSFGLRLERARVDAMADDRFGPAAGRSFTAGSGALGTVWSFQPGYALAVNWASSQRAPNYQELFANGPHLATGIYEVGDATLGRERANGLDLALRKTDGPLTGSIGLYHQRFRNFISLNPTGQTDAESTLPIYAYRGVAARFYGLEWSGRARLWQAQPSRLDLEVKGDISRADDLDAGTPLPRIAPRRVTVALDWRDARANARLEVTHAARQNRLAPNETATSGYTLLNAYAGYRFGWTGFDLEAFVRGNNLLNREIRNHVSFIKDIAPLAGRNVMVGLRGEF